MGDLHMLFDVLCICSERINNGIGVLSPTGVALRIDPLINNGIGVLGATGVALPAAPCRAWYRGAW